MSIVKEFKAFAMKGNVVDMAVGIIIGAAFGKIVSSLVSDVIMPPIGLLVGGVKFSDLSVKMPSPIPGNPDVLLNYGNFIQVTFDFMIVAFAVFMMIKVINAAKRKEEETPANPAKPSNEEVLLTEIRDLLKKK